MLTGPLLFLYDSLDLFWLRDADNLPDPDVIVDEIVEDLRAALEQLEAIQSDLTTADPEHG